MRPCGSATQWKLYQQVSNVNPANAKQVTSTASVSPVEDAVVVKYVNIGLSNGMKIEYHNLSYSGLQSFIWLKKSIPQILAKNRPDAAYAIAKGF